MSDTHSASTQNIAASSSDTFAKRLDEAQATRQWHWEQRAKRAVKALQANQFEALYVQDHAAALQAIWERIPPQAQVGLGGSLSLRQLALPEQLSEAGHTLADHWTPGLTPEEVLAVRRAQLTSDVFLTSVNALTLSGQLVSMDGIGNRVAAMTFGPGKVIVVAGAQKIVDSLDDAYTRIRSVCAPQALNTIGATTPCAQTGLCGACPPHQRLCRITLVLDAKPIATEMTVIVVGEELGI